MLFAIIILAMSLYVYNPACMYYNFVVRVSFGSLKMMYIAVLYINNASLL